MCLALPYGLAAGGATAWWVHDLVRSPHDAVITGFVVFLLAVPWSGPAALVAVPWDGVIMVMGEAFTWR
jgi:hypothetical protein